MRLVIPLIMGILVQYHLALPLIYLYTIGILTIVWMGIYPILRIREKFFAEPYYGMALKVLFITLGALLLDQHTQVLLRQDEEKHLYLAEIIQIPAEKENSYQTEFGIKEVYKDSSWQALSMQTLAYFEQSDAASTLEPGQWILFEGYIQPVENMGNPIEFDYKRFLSVHGIHHRTYISEQSWQKIQRETRPSVRALSNRVRLYLLYQLEESGLSNQQLAVGSALTLGYKDQLNQQTRAAFSDSGAMHILAVSGLHVGIIYLLFHSILFFMNKSKSTRIVKTLIILHILVAYAFITGLSPSVTRATLMFGVISIGNISNRNTSVYNSLAFSAMILLVINPLRVFSVGFQLSYMAVFAIVFFQPRIYQLIAPPKIADKPWQLFSVSLAAQIGTAPLVMYYFHQFPNYFWLTNFLAIPAAMIIVMLGMSIFLIHPLIPALAKGLGWCLNWFIETLNRLMESIQQLPLSVTKNIFLENEMVWLVYLCIFCVTLFVLSRQGRFLILAFTSILFLTIVDINRNLRIQDNREFIIFNIPKESVYNYIHQEKNILITDSTKPKDLNYSFFAEELWLQRGAKHPYRIHFQTDPSTLDLNHLWIHQPFFSIHQKTFCRIHDESYAHLKTVHKLKIDYLILSNNTTVSIQTLENLFDFHSIIIDSSNSFYQRKKWMQTFEEKGIVYHSVPEDGAFHLRFM